MLMSSLRDKCKGPTKDVRLVLSLDQSPASLQSSESDTMDMP